MHSLLPIYSASAIAQANILAVAKNYPATWRSEDQVVRRSKSGEFAPKDKVQPDMTWSISPEVEAIACQTDERLQVLSDTFNGFEPSVKNELAYIFAPTVEQFFIGSTLVSYLEAKEQIEDFLSRQISTIAFRSILRYTHAALRSEGLTIDGAFGILWAIAPISGWIIVKAQRQLLFEMAGLDTDDIWEPLPALDNPSALHGWGAALLFSGEVPVLSLHLLNKLLFDDF